MFLRKFNLSTTLKKKKKLHANCQTQLFNPAEGVGFFLIWGARRTAEETEFSI